MAEKTSKGSTPPAGKAQGLENRRHELFAQGMAKGLSGRDAYKAAGFAPGTAEAADAAASRLLREDKVDARIKALLGKAAEKAEVTAERVIAELAKIGFGDIRQVVSWRPEMTLVEAEGEGGEPTQVMQSRVTVLDSATLSDDAAAAIAEVSQGANGVLRIKMHDKPAALEKLGRTLGIFKDKVEMTGKDGAPLTPTIILSGRPESPPAPKAVARVRKQRD